jgi:Cytochrome P460
MQPIARWMQRLVYTLGEARADTRSMSGFRERDRAFDFRGRSYRKQPRKHWLLLGAVCVAVLVLLAHAARLTVVRASAAEQTAASFTYDKDGHFLVPKDYREWVFLSSGIDMVYGPKGASGMGHSMFDNVFVNRDAYRSFLVTGQWPDRTAFILEVRGAETNVSINHGGHSQGEMMGMEVHVRDTSRFHGGWAFFDVNDAGKGKLIPESANCYSCHQEHGAVDTTFTQFYPTLLKVAKAKGTLSAAYIEESAAAAGK